MKTGKALGELDANDHLGLARRGARQPVIGKDVRFSTKLSCDSRWDLCRNVWKFKKRLSFQFLIGEAARLRSITGGLLKIVNVWTQKPLRVNKARADFIYSLPEVKHNFETNFEAMF
jgi:hypothetical protein